MPSTSVYISHKSASRAAAIATAVVSEPPLPRVVISPSLLTPWKPAIIIILPWWISSIILEVLISEILAEPWILSVVIPACKPDKLRTSISNDYIDNAKRVEETNSPVESKVSFSLRYGFLLLKVTSSDIFTRSSVVLPIAETTTTGE